MGKTTGFLEYDRKDGINVEPKNRIEDFKDIEKNIFFIFPFIPQPAVQNSVNNISSANFGS